MAEDNGARALPPYVSYAGFRALLTILKEHFPERIDRSLMSNMSGAGQSAMLAALRYLELITENGVPQPALHQLVEADDKAYGSLLRDILKARYAFLSNGLSLERATTAQVVEKFRELGMSGSTVAKAIGFFLAAAKDAALPVSPHVKTPAVPRGSSPRRARSGRLPPEAVPTPPAAITPVEPSPKSWQEQLLQKFPTFDPTWDEETKKKWFDAFEKLMAASGTKEGAK